MTALEIAGISHSFGQIRALDDVAFSVEAGSFTALLGINGAGKSTLFNLITRLYDNRAGVIRVAGQDVRQAPEAALAQLGVVFQSRALDANLTVAQNFVYHAALHGIGRREALGRGRALLARVGLGDRISAKVRTLSGGQVRRAEIARALLHRPRLLLCDEATVGLDVAARRDIVAEVHRLAAEEGVAVLWATHLIDEIAPDDTVIVLHRGKVLANGAAADIAGTTSLAEAFLKLTGAQGVA